MGFLRSAYNVAKEWQAMIGAIMGFGGVILTILYTHNATVQDDERRRRTDTFALRAALASELTMDAGYLGELIHDMEKDPTQAAIAMSIFRAPTSSIYDKNLDKIMLLSTCEIQHLVSAYVYFAAISNAMAQAEHYPENLKRFAINIPKQAIDRNLIQNFQYLLSSAKSNASDAAAILGAQTGCNPGYPSFPQMVAEKPKVH